MHRGVIAMLAALATLLVAAGEQPAPASDAPRALPFFYDLYTFRGEGGKETTTVVATFAVRTGRLEDEREEWGVRYRFDVTLALIDPPLRTLTRTDSVFVRVPRSLGGDHLLSTHLEVDAPPSSSTVQRVILTDATTPGVGQLYTTPFPVPDYSGSELMLSDVALGLPEASSGWKRGENTLALLPTGHIPGREFDVYYEIYNLPAGTSYRTQITIDRLDQADDPLTLEFTSDALADEDDTVQELRRVGTSLEEGEYELTVTVTDHRSGETVTRKRPLVVRDWGPGATLVRAHTRNSNAGS